MTLILGRRRLRRPMAKSRREAATILALKACKSATSAVPSMRFTIQRAWNAVSKATAVGNCRLLFKLCQGVTNETEEMTTQKKVSPAKMVMMIATEKLRCWNSGLASSELLPTDSNPDIIHGTTCQTSRIEISGV